MSRRIFTLAAVFALSLATLPAFSSGARADGCYICTSGSSCGQYCRYAGTDSYPKRKACQKAGCKIGGTASCPSAANVRICSGIGFLLPAPKTRMTAMTAWRRD